MELERLQIDVHHHVLDLRSIEGTIHKPFFARLFAASNEEQIKEIRKIIMEGDKLGVARWMESHPDIQLGEMSHNRLKRIGKALNIPHYSRLDVIALAQRIEELQNGKKPSDSKPTSNASSNVIDVRGSEDKDNAHSNSG